MNEVSRLASMGRRRGRAICALVAAVLVMAASPAVRGEGARAGSPGRARLTFLKTLLTRHGNAAHLAWSDDGKALFLANEEGVMSAVKIDVSDPARPRIAATRGDRDFLWALAQRNGLLVFHQSAGGDTVRVDPQTFALRWAKTTGVSHAIATDGSRIFLALEGKPGVLAVLDGSGNTLARATAQDGWSDVYGLVYEATTRRLYVAAGEGAAQGSPGGIYIYDVSAVTPRFRGKIPRPSSDIAVRGTKLWRQRGGRLEAWDVSHLAGAKLLGAWEEPDQEIGGEFFTPSLAGFSVNAAGTRLYMAYWYTPRGSQNPVLDHLSAGFAIFDVSGSAPRLLARHPWKTSLGLNMMPFFAELSPDNRILAVSFWTFGVRLYRVAGDVVTELGMVATTGEAHDVFVDNVGTVHVFANDNIQIIDPRTGSHTGVFVTGNRIEGGWRPFKDGTIILPTNRGGGVLKIQNGRVEYVGSVEDPGSTTWDLLFEDPYLYMGAEDGGLYIRKIGAVDAASRTYPATPVGSVTVQQAGQSQFGPAILAVTKQGNLVWVLGPGIGVAAINVSNPASPRIVFHDGFAFSENGAHVGIVAARGRIYAGAGDKGVIIYNPTTLRRTGSIKSLNVNFLDTVGDDLLVVAHYWITDPSMLPEGMYAYDLRANPDAPTLLDRFPRSGGSPGFRARVFGKRIYRVPLYGVDILEIP